MLTSAVSSVVAVETAGIRVPIWSLPIFIIIAIAASIYQKKRDKAR